MLQCQNKLKGRVPMHLLGAAQSPLVNVSYMPLPTTKGENKKRMTMEPTLCPCACGSCQGLNLDCQL